MDHQVLASVGPVRPISLCLHFDFLCRGIKHISRRFGSRMSLLWAWHLVLSCSLGLLDSEHILLDIHFGLYLDHAIFTFIGGSHTPRRDHGGLV